MKESIRDEYKALKEEERQIHFNYNSYNDYNPEYRTVLVNKIQGIRNQIKEFEKEHLEILI